MKSEKGKDISKPINVEQAISLMELYQDEWKHRDNDLRERWAKLFYASLITTILPNFPGIGTSFPSIASVVFRAAGIVMSVFSIMLCFGLYSRAKAAQDSYKKINNQLPLEYKRKAVDEDGVFPLYRKSMDLILISASFCSIIVVSLVLILCK